jgi:nitroreductase
LQEKSISIYKFSWYDLEKRKGAVNMNETLKNLKERRSCRKYQEKQVDAAVLDLILEAGTYAPTGMNRQAPVIVAVQDPETVKKISKMNAAVMGVDSDPFYGAPTVLVVLADPEIRTYVYDGALVMGNLMNAAHAVGVDSCYIFRAKEVFATEEGKAMLRAWGIPERYEGIGNCILGYREEGGVKAASARKENYIVKV